jgi:hypothetical protein
MKHVACEANAANFPYFAAKIVCNYINLSELKILGLESTT